MINAVEVWHNKIDREVIEIGWMNGDKRGMVEGGRWMKGGGGEMDEGERREEGQRWSKARVTHVTSLLTVRQSFHSIRVIMQSFIYREES